MRVAVTVDIDVKGSGLNEEFSLKDNIIFYKGFINKWSSYTGKGTYSLSG